MLFRSLGFPPAALRPVDVAHAAVYAAVTNIAYEMLDDSSVE